ncbi:hypothetical protein BJ322DRAFT_998673, partial [Thelephora terrestris]
IMSDSERFEVPDPDLILRARGPPNRDFRVHKLVLSLASPVFRGMFSLPQPTTPHQGESDAAQIDVVEVTDAPRALDTILRMIYPFEPPTFNGNLDGLVECLVVADKYEIKGAMSRLRGALSRLTTSKALRVYAIASRFEFADIAESASRHILTSVNLTGIPQLPEDFGVVPATTYHKLVRAQANRLETVVDIINRTPLQSYADLILRVRGPPKRDFRVHKLVLSLASPVFKRMFTPSRPTTPTQGSSRESDVAQIGVFIFPDPPRALDIVLRMIYPFQPPNFGDNLDVLVECLDIAEKYEINGAMSRLRGALSRASASEALRVYAIASRFGFTDIAESASCLILPSLDLTGIPRLPEDFESVPATIYHKLVRLNRHYLEAVVEDIDGTPFKTGCYSCPGARRFTEEVFRARLARIIMMGTPAEFLPCFRVWVKTYGLNTDCETDCVRKFIRAAISRVGKQLNSPVTPSPARRKSILKNA